MSMFKKSSLRLLRQYSFLINKDNLSSGLFCEQVFHPDDFSTLSLEERVKPLRSFFDFNLFEEPPREIPRPVVKELLTTTDVSVLDSLRTYANHVTENNYDKTVYLRGIIEFSNMCDKNCFYCGIRHDNYEIQRYYIPHDEIVSLALECDAANYGTLMLQSGEMMSQGKIDRLCETIEEICEKTDLCVALSIGELEKEQYQQLYDSGAHRYLLRIETSSPELYSKMHPESHSWQRRDSCIDTLKDIGFYVGTGVLVNVPGQTVDDLVSDLFYIQEKGADMIGIGPYVIQNNTPMAEEWLEENEGIDIDVYNAQMFNATLNMYSLTRILNPRVNMSATTALQLLDPRAREIALLAGSNVVMPILTPPKYRKDYKLYEKKQIVDNVKQRDELFESILAVGKVLNLDGSWGDPKTRA